MSLTIQKIKWQVLVSIQDIRNIVDDARVNVCGGLSAGLEIWELAIIPMLLYNAESWLGISSKTISMIEDLQKKFLRVLLGAATGTPLPALYWETGTLLIKNRIMFRKLMFLHHLETLPKDSLAHEVFKLQKNLNLPGLAYDCSEVLCNLNLTNIQEYSKEQWKRIVKKEVFKRNKEDLINETKTLKKISYKTEDDFERQTYLSDMNVIDARLLFKVKTKMLPTVQMNFVSDEGFSKNLWTCSGCFNPSLPSLLHGQRDTQQHILSCSGYVHLRMGRNLECEKDLVDHFRDVIRLRGLHG